MSGRATSVSLHHLVPLAVRAKDHNKGRMYMHHVTRFASQLFFSAAPPFQHVNPIACVTLHHSSVCSLDNYQNIDHEKSSRKQHMVQLTFKIEFLFQIRNFYFFFDDF